MIVSHNTNLSKGGRLLRGLWLGENIERAITRHINEKYLYHFQEIAEEVIKGRLSPQIAEVYCFNVLSKGMEDPKCTWEKGEGFEKIKALFISKSDGLPMILNTSHLSKTYRNSLTTLTEKLEKIEAEVNKKKRD